MYTDQGSLVTLLMSLSLRLAFLLQSARKSVRMRTGGNLRVFISCATDQRYIIEKHMLRDIQLAGSSCPHCSQVTIDSPSCGRSSSVPHVGQKSRDPGGYGRYNRNGIDKERTNRLCARLSLT
jgi:hypothetical protein